MRPGAEPMLEVKDLEKIYTIWKGSLGRARGLFGLGKPAREVHALHGLSFEVKPGEAVGVIGRNGSGKSTLLKILSGLGLPTRGEVKVRGRVQALLELGTGFHPDFSGRENLYFSAMLMGLSRTDIDGLVDGILDFSELRDVIDQPLRTYSTGMKMRLAFSVATALRPDILLLDEVLAVGDSFFQFRCFERMDKFVRGGGTLLLVSHDLSSILRTCPRTIWIDKGRITRDADSTTVIRDYRQAMVDEEEARLKAARTPEQKAASQFVLDRMKGDKKAMILGVHFTDETGKKALVFHPGRALEGHIRFQVFEPLPKLVVALSLYRTDGVVAAQPISNLDGLSPRAFEPGEYEAKVRFDPLLIGPGDYVVSTSLHPDIDPRDRGALVIFDVRDQADVLNIARDPEHSIERGIVHHPVRWQIDPLAKGST
jgi:homopolymeric O-antigen transport system ATP-binding protein